MLIDMTIICLKTLTDNLTALWNFMVITSVSKEFDTYVHKYCSQYRRITLYTL